MEPIATGRFAPTDELLNQTCHDPVVGLALYRKH